MALTSDPKRIEEAHFKLQRLEDIVVGFMTPVNGKAIHGDTEMIYQSRLKAVWEEIWEVIYDLNEAYDKKG